MLFVRFRCTGHMACQALFIVACVVFYQVPVRIVTRRAAEPCVAVPPAFAAHQAVRLRAYIGDAFHVRELDVPPRAVAGAAKVDGIRGIEFSRVENQLPAFFVADPLLERARFHRYRVLQPRSMAALAGYAFHQPAGVEILPDLGGDAVAGETPLDLRNANRPRPGFLEVLWIEQCSRGSEIQVIQGAEEGDAALKIISIAQKKIGLSDFPGSEGPGQRVGERPLSIAHREVGFPPVHLDFVRVVLIFEFQVTSRLKIVCGFCPDQCVCHRSCDLRRGHFCVAF